jgi:hypothetical protein
MNEHVKGAAPAAPKAPVPPQAPKAPAAANGAPKEAKPPKAPKEPKQPKESNFAKVYPDGAIITVKADKNPKRAGTKAHGTFELYKSGMTVGDFIKAGGYYAALSWDVGHGFVTVG